MSTLGSTSRTMAGEVLNRVYAPNDVPVKPNYPYAEISSVGWVPAAYTLDRTHGLRDHQLVIRVFGRTEDSMNSVMESLLGVFVDAYVGELGPGRMELAPTIIARDLDDNGVLGSIATVSFAGELPEEEDS